MIFIPRGEKVQTAHEAEHICKSEDLRSEQPPVRTKFNISMEKKIERLWRESERLGWSYSQFVSVLMEVLTVLHHRNKLQRAEPASTKIPHRRHALS